MRNARATSIADSPTLSRLATEAGIILGTAAYMSPEQAKGFPADQRSDIFSFGVVLFEMLTGRRPFQGETAAEVLASVIVRDPELATLPARAEPANRRPGAPLPREASEAQVAGDRRCARGDRGDPRRASDHFDDRGASGARARVAPCDPAGCHCRHQRRADGTRDVEPHAITRAPAITRFSVPLPNDHQLLGNSRQILALSRDGTQIAYAANGRVYVRPMSGLDVYPIQGIESGEGVADIAFSPDGRALVFWTRDRVLKRIPVGGGAAITLCEAEAPFGLSWDRDGIVFGQPIGIMRISPDGGKPEVLVRAKNGELLFGPQVLPGGETVLFTVATSPAVESWNRAVIVVQSLKTGERKTLVEGGADGRYVPTGHIVYAVGGTLFDVPFDLRRLEVRAGPTAIVEGVMRATAAASGTAHYAFADNGSLAYVPGPAGSNSEQFDIAITDRGGKMERLNLPDGPYEYPRVSPDGKRITFGTDNGREAVVWVYDLAGRSAMQRLTIGGKNRYPIWSADGQRIAFQSDREGDAAIFWQRADRTGGAERLTKPAPGTRHVPDAWSRDGKHLLFSVESGGSFTLSMLTLGDRTAAPFGNVESTARATPDFSPDGRWVAYSASEQGTAGTQVYVQPFPPSGARYQLAAKAGDFPHHPLWTPDGKELIYVPRVGELEAVPVEKTPTLVFGNSVRVPRTFPMAAPTTPRTFDIAPNGKIVSVVVPTQNTTAGARQRSIQVVLNWFEELKAIGR